MHFARSALNRRFKGFTKRYIAEVVAHELSHQWFGNLVTMKWWDNLWLNEGFASWIEYLAVDHCFPEWDIWTQFVYSDLGRAMNLDYPLIWAGLIAASVLLYVLLDGFDLGIGILFPFAPSDKCRDRMMNSIAPFWDGNETWLVLGGGGLFAAFPLAYSILFPAFM